ncbi:MAG: ATP-binding cassette domain-containing protein, partial [Nitrospinota bacterium]|nr:ATP-binding cassette domain-containing protein [Nitrospinota bacterium]
MVLASPLLRVFGVSLNKGKAVLKDVSCKLERGEILVLLGPSGSGKSSLLRCLNRLETIDEGEIFLTGRNVSEIHSVDLRRKVGMVFQTPILLPGTVRENIKMGPHLQNKFLDESE